MGRVIKIKISARGVETDAPTVEDLLEQLRDYFDLLKEVEVAIAPDGSNAIEWRIVNAGRSSPLSFEAEAYPRQYGVNIDDRVDIVATKTANGLVARRELRRESPAPGTQGRAFRSIGVRPG